MCAVSEDTGVDILDDRVIILVEFGVPVSYVVDGLADERAGLVMNVDVSIGVCIGVVVEALADVIIVVVTDIDVGLLGDVNAIALSAVMTAVEFITMRSPLEELFLFIRTALK